MPIPQEKIKVFISSACGTEPEKYKYNLVRAGLKALIESTNLAKVYVFESEGASTYSAGQHYTYALEECDVCIFLIDNYDKIPDGVQVEIDTANKHHIKSLYYFCDETSKEETPLQRSLKGSKFAKSKVVHSFQDFITRGVKDLMEDLVNIYKIYCDGRIDWIDNVEMEKKSSYLLTDPYYNKNYLIEKGVIGSIDKIKDYFSKMILERFIEIKKTNELDKLCSKFLDVMFNNQSIQEFNLGLLLREIQKEQTAEHYEVTKKRWDAIQEYYLGNVEVCISILENALELAKKNKLSEWLIKDILIDLRNQQCFLDEKNNVYKINNKFQTEIIESKHLLHYPLIDRLYSDYYENILKNNMKSITQSPHTISFGHNLYSSIEYLSSITLLAMVNGSLSYLQLIYDKVRQLSFYCCEKYSDWNFRILLIKTTIINCNSKEIDRMTIYFDDIICKMDSEDAKEIYDFASNRPIKHQRFIAKLEAIGVVGYFMNENDFKVAWKELFEQINVWIKDMYSSVVIGSHIYRALKNIYLRIHQDDIALICYESLKSKKYRFFRDIFDLILSSININKLSENMRINLLDEIIKIIGDRQIKKSSFNIEPVLYTFRKQNRELTENLDQTIAEYMPEFYDGDYNLEVTEKIQDMESYIEKYLIHIEERNTSQGKNGKYIGYANRPHIIIKNILKQNDIKFDNDKIDDIFKVTCSTLLEDTQTIEEKMEAIELLVYLCKTNFGILDRNVDLVLELKENKDRLESGKSIMSNLSEMHLHFSALLLYNSLGEEICLDMIESLATIGDDLLSQIHVSKSILYFLESGDKVLLSSQLEPIILQNAFKWCNSSSRDVRWYAIRILFSLLGNPENHKMICNQLVKHMDSDNVYIKNSILNKVNLIKDIDPATYDYILEKASIDTNFVVREVCKNIKKL